MKRNFFFRITVTIFTILSFFLLPLSAQKIEEFQREFTDLRFGAFFHFGIRTFTGGSWGEPNQDVSKFNPTDLDCSQWAEALQAAKMKFGILTTKHHDGFCLWNSEYTDNDVASSPWKNGEGDVVQEYVDAFRASNLEPCLYYSVWDNTEGVGNGPITKQDMEFIKGQLTEILSNYGNIKILFIDGWSWKTGHKNVPYDEIRTLVKDLQPECLLVDNTHLRCLYDNDLIHFEEGSPCPPDNTLPALLSKLIYINSGNGWFWDNRIPTANLLSINEIVNTHLSYLEPKWCTFILNCPPNPEGKLDANIVQRLNEVGKTWSPNLDRLALPVQAPQIDRPVTPQSATATSGNAFYAIDGFNDRFYYSVWESSKALPQAVTIDLGQEYNDIGILTYVPKYKSVITPVTEGSIKSYKIYKSTDNTDFSQIAMGEWNGDVNMKVVTFTPTSARYIRLEALTAVDDFAAATEIAIGRENKPTSIDNSHSKIYRDSFKLEQNYPNPFNLETIIDYQLLEAGRVRLEVYNVLGEKISTLMDRNDSTGSFSVSWFAQDEPKHPVPSGVYLYRLLVENSNGTFSDLKKMILLR